MKVLNSITTAVSLCLPIFANAGVMPGDSFEQVASTTVTRGSAVKTSTAKNNGAAVETKQPRAMQLYASDKAAELTYERTGPFMSFNNSRASVSFLFNERRDNVVTGSVLYDTESAFLSGLTLSFGSKLYAGLLGIENADAVGLAVAFEAAYKIPVRQLPVKLSAGVNYAPDIFTFGQSDRIIDWNVRSGLNLTKNIEGFVGFRFLQFDTQPGDRESDERFHLGVRWNLGN